FPFPFQPPAGASPYPSATAFASSLLGCPHNQETRSPDNPLAAILNSKMSARPRDQFSLACETAAEENSRARIRIRSGRSPRWECIPGGTAARHLVSGSIRADKHPADLPPIGCSFAHGPLTPSTRYIQTRRQWPSAAHLLPRVFASRRSVRVPGTRDLAC